MAELSQDQTFHHSQTYTWRLTVREYATGNDDKTLPLVLLITATAPMSHTVTLPGSRMYTSLVKGGLATNPPWSLHMKT